MKKIVFLTGAGISAESGIKTFRDCDGLWQDFKIEEVATSTAWDKNPTLVNDFYNLRRIEILKSKPNKAHYLIASLDDNYIVTTITQNIDDLHKRAGSLDIIHLHGEILKSRSSNPIYDPVYIAGQDEVVYVKINIKHHQATNKEKTPYTTFTQKVDSACKRAIYRKAKKA